MPRPHGADPAMAPPGREADRMHGRRDVVGAFDISGE